MVGFCVFIYNYRRKLRQQYISNADMSENQQLLTEQIDLKPNDPAVESMQVSPKTWVEGEHVHDRSFSEDIGTEGHVGTEGLVEE